TDNNITAANAAALGLPPEDVGALGGVDQSTFVMAKITHNSSSKNTLTATLAYTRDSNSNVAVTPFATRSRQLRILPYDWAGQVLWTNIVGNGGWLNELQLAYFPRSY